MNQQLTEPVVDQETIASLLELDDGGSFLNDLFEQYVEQAGRLILEAGEAASIDDVDSWVAALHALSGSSRNVGASRLATVCSTAEADGRTHGRIRTVSYLDRVYAEYDAYRAEMGGVLRVG